MRGEDPALPQTVFVERNFFYENQCCTVSGHFGPNHLWSASVIPARFSLSSQPKKRQCSSLGDEVCRPPYQNLDFEVEVLLGKGEENENFEFSWVSDFG